MSVLRWCLGGALLSACMQSTTLPGTSEGSFSVTGTLGTNTCGTSLGASNPWDFTVAVSEDGSTVYLQSTTDSNELTGTLNGNAVTLSSVVTSNVGGDADAGTTGPCNITQTTTYTITFDNAAAPTTFTGSASYTYAAATTIATNTDCSGQLAASGGSYATLPCTVNYTVTAKKK